MFEKKSLKKGDEIYFFGHGLMIVIDITTEDIIVGKNQYDKKGAKLDSLRMSRINGRLYSRGSLQTVYGE